MEIIISGRHLGVTEEMKAHAERRLQTVAAEYPKLTTARVVMEMERNWHIVEVHLNGKHLDLEAKAKTTDMYASIDEAAEKIEKQLRKYLDRVHDHRGRNGQAEEEQAAEGPDDELDADEEKV
jgi:putative sigma-54 modulation protein